MAPINSAPTRFSGGHILAKGPSEIGHRPRVKCTFYEKNLTWQNPASISGSRTGLPGCGPCRGLGSKNGPSSARVCPKGSGPHSAAKQRRSFRVPPINHPEACVPKAVEATFCSKTGPIFSCGSNKLCPRLDLVAATSWEGFPPEIGHRPRVKRTFYEKNLPSQTPALISRSRNGSWAGGS